jgi:ABC-type transport system involved in Fe-S cluster assembly fused permease/ATPase subunit
MDRCSGLNKPRNPGPAGRSHSPASASIRFEHVDFSYDPNRRFCSALRDRRAKVAVGSGKSMPRGSCIALPTSAYRRDQWIDIRELQQVSLRARSPSPQDTACSTIRSITTSSGRPKVDDEESCRAGRAYPRFHASLPDGYDARVGSAV